jgi:hypothetical protein
MAAFLYRCRNTGLRVQGWLAGEPAQHGEHYELVNCLAEYATIIYTWDAARHRLDGGPFKFAEFVAHDSRLRFGSLNHAQGGNINRKGI